MSLPQSLDVFIGDNNQLQLYQMGDFLEGGTFGKVYLLNQVDKVIKIIDLPNLVIKHPKKQSIPDEKKFELWKDSIVLSCKHPDIFVKIDLAYISTNKQGVIVMERMHKSLEQLIEENGMNQMYRKLLENNIKKQREYKIINIDLTLKNFMFNNNMDQIKMIDPDFVINVDDVHTSHISGAWDRFNQILITNGQKTI